MHILHVILYTQLGILLPAVVYFFYFKIARCTKPCIRLLSEKQFSLMFQVLRCIQHYSKNAVPA